MSQVHGHCDPRFSKVRDLLDKYTSSAEELGASICVNIEGRTVVDIWGGYKDTSRSQPWTENTIVPVWSTSKTITNLAALILIDRGLLDPYGKVSQYWPEFAANGKQDVEVRHFLSHTSGVPSWDRPITIDDIYDIPKATEKLAAQAPWWTPGSASGYHLVSQGHLVGELVRRVTGKSLGQFITEEIAGPLGADFQLGALEEDWSRIADVVPPGMPLSTGKPDKTSVQYRAFTGTPIKAEHCMTPEFLRSQMGASNGISNARAVARILSMISLGGELDGKRWLSPKTIDFIFHEQSNGKDLVLDIPIRFGIGYALSLGNDDMIPPGRVCRWGGWGGSIAIMDIDRKMTVSYTMNKMETGTLGNERTKEYVKAIYQAMNERSLI